MPPGMADTGDVIWRRQTLMAEETGIVTVTPRTSPLYKTDRSRWDQYVQGGAIEVNRNRARPECTRGQTPE